jgi:MFS family permease
MPYVPGISAKIALTTIGVALPSVIYLIGNAVVSEIAPVAQRGALLAIGTAVSTSAGLLAPYVMGSVVEMAATPLDGFNPGFMICGVIMLVGERHRHVADASGARNDPVGERNARGGGGACLKERTALYRDRFWRVSHLRLSRARALRLVSTQTMHCSPGSGHQLRPAVRWSLTPRANRKSASAVSRLADSASTTALG